jgi:hypothetical protein
MLMNKTEKLIDVAKDIVSILGVTMAEGMQISILMFQVRVIEDGMKAMRETLENKLNQIVETHENILNN